MSETNLETEFANSNMSADVQQATVSNGEGFFARFIAKGGGVALAAIAAAGTVAVLSNSTDNEPVAPDPPAGIGRPTETNNCPVTNLNKSEVPAVELSVARANVADMKFGITVPAYDSHIGAIRSSSDTKLIEQELKNSGNKVSVFFNTKPTNSESTFSPDGVTLDEAKKHADEFLQVLSKTPQSLLDKMPKANIYMVSELKDKEGKSIEATWGTTPDGEDFMLLNALHTSSDPAKYHSVENAVTGYFARLAEIGLCGKDAGEDKEFAAINQSNQPAYDAHLKYTRDPSELSLRTDHSYFVNSYSRTGVMADVLTTGGMLLENGYISRGRSYAKSSDGKVLSPIDEKKELIIARQATIEPNIRNYYIYLAHINGRPFPGEVARAANENLADATQTECLVNITAGSYNMQEIDIPIKNWVTMQPDTITVRAVHQTWDYEAFGTRGARAITYAYPWKGVTDKETDQQLDVDYDRQVEEGLNKLPGYSPMYANYNMNSLIRENNKTPQSGHCNTITVHVR